MVKTNKKRIFCFSSCRKKKINLENFFEKEKIILKPNPV